MIAEELREAAQTRKSGTRDAVETAIGLAKEDKSGTWESSLSRTPRRINRWGTKKFSTRQRGSE